MLQQQAAQVRCLDMVRLEPVFLGPVADGDDYVVGQLARRNERPALDGVTLVVTQESGFREVAVRLVLVVGVRTALGLEWAVAGEYPALCLKPAVVPLVTARPVYYLIGMAVLRGEETIAKASE